MRGVVKIPYCVQRRWKSWLFMILLAVPFSVATSDLTQASEPRTYEQAFELYKRRYYTEALKIVDLLVAQETSPPSKARNLKLKAILHYMKGDQQTAGQVFQQSLQLDPNITVRNDEIFHPMISKFFAQERRRFRGVQVGTETTGSPPLYHLNKPLASDRFVDHSSGGLANSMPLGSANLQEPYDPIAAMGAEPRERETSANQANTASVGPAMAPGAQKPLAGTLLTVNCNVKEGKVYVDGILVGDVNVPFQAQPGVVDVEVNAPGYEPQTKRLLIEKDKQLTASIILKKSVVKSKVVAKASPKKALSGSANVKGAVVADRSLARPSRMNPKAEAKSLFSSSGKAKPMLERDLAKEFEKDATTLAQPSPPQVYNPFGGGAGFGAGSTIPQVQGGYVFPQAGGSQAPIIIIQVPPAGAASPAYANPYAPQTPAAPGGAINPNGPAPPPAPPGGIGGPLIAPPPKSGNSMTGGKNKSGPKKYSHIWRLMPLGIPQFYLGQPILGSVFALGQVGGMYFYFSRTAAADEEVAKANSTVLERNAYQKTIADAQEAEKYEGETLAFAAKQQQIVNQSRQEALLGIPLAGGLWAISVIMAYVYLPEDAETPAKSRLSLLYDEQNKWGLRVGLNDWLPSTLEPYGLELHWYTHGVMPSPSSRLPILALSWDL